MRLSECQYAWTRDSSTNENSINYGRSFCRFFNASSSWNPAMKPDSGDMHGGHTIFTAGFKSSVLKMQFLEILEFFKCDEIL